METLKVLHMLAVYPLAVDEGSTSWRSLVLLLKFLKYSYKMFAEYMYFAYIWFSPIFNIFYRNLCYYKPF